MKQNMKNMLLCVLIFAVSALPQLLALELSYYPSDEWGSIAPVNWAVGYVTILFVSVALLFLFNRPWLALGVSAFITTGDK